MRRVANIDDNLKRLCIFAILLVIPANVPQVAFAGRLAPYATRRCTAVHATARGQQPSAGRKKMKKDFQGVLGMVRGPFKGPYEALYRAL